MLALRQTHGGWSCRTTTAISRATTFGTARTGCGGSGGGVFSERSVSSLLWNSAPQQIEVTASVLLPPTTCNASLTIGFEKPYHGSMGTTTTTTMMATTFSPATTLIQSAMRDAHNALASILQDGLWFISTLKRRRKMMNKHKLRKRRKKNRMKSKK